MVEIIDLEDFSKENANERPEKGKKYQIRVDREKYVVTVETMTGKEILELAHKSPFNRYQLNQKYRHGLVKKIEYSATVDFTEPGIERFMTIPLDQTDGGK